jgi:hypothetical protein
MGEKTAIDRARLLAEYKAAIEEIEQLKNVRQTIDESDHSSLLKVQEQIYLAVRRRNLLFEEIQLTEPVTG